MDVWVTPPANRSRWFAHLDWQLNWQMCKALAHKPASPALELVHMAHENQLQLPLFPPLANDAPLLVHAEGRLPVTHCLLISNGGELRAWLKNVQTSLSTLKPERARVFLPSGATALQAIEIWESLNLADVHLEFTTDEDLT